MCHVKPEERPTCKFLIDNQHQWNFSVHELGVRKEFNITTISTLENSQSCLVKYINFYLDA